MSYFARRGFDSHTLHMRRMITTSALVLALLPLIDLPAQAAKRPCDVTITAPANLNARLRAAGPGKVVCLEGKFVINEETQAWDRQVLRGPATIVNAGRVVNGINLKRGGSDGATDVQLNHLEISGFLERGVVCNDGTTARKLNLHHNEQNGFGCNLNNRSNASVWIHHSRIHHNGSLKWEGHISAGMKFVHTGPRGASVGSAVSVTDNRVYSNYGNGVWFDIDSAGDLVQGNRIWGNTRYGVRYEVSFGPVLIQGNDIVSSVKGYSGINITDSSFATVRGNTARGEDWDIDVFWKDRRDGNPLIDIVIGPNDAPRVLGCNLKGVTC